MLVVLYCTVVLIAFRLVIYINRNLLASKDRKLFMCPLLVPLIYKNRGHSTLPLYAIHLLLLFIVLYVQSVAVI